MRDLSYLIDSHDEKIGRIRSLKAPLNFFITDQYNRMNFYNEDGAVPLGWRAEIPDRQADCFSGQALKTLSAFKCAGLFLVAMTGRGRNGKIK